MSDILSSARAASRAIAKMSGKRNGRTDSDQRGMRWADVVAVNGKYADVMMDGTVHSPLRYTRECDGMAEGDRVIVQYMGREPVIVGVMSNGAVSNPVSSVTYPDSMTVEGYASSGAVTLHVRQDSGQTATTTEKSEIALVSDAFRPKVEVRSIFGIQDGAWGMLTVDVDGTVSVSHVFADGQLSWSGVDISVTFAY